MILQQGIHCDIPESDYHADPCPEPSLSRSCIRDLVSKTPQHAKASHPRFYLQPEEKGEAKFDLGTAAHALLLQGEDRAEIIDAADWKTAKAREARDAARMAGKLPFLPHQWNDVLLMVRAAEQQIYACDELGINDLYKDGKAEQTLVWQEENGIWCRVRPDWWSNDKIIMLDYKTAGQTANPDVFNRKAVDLGYDIQDQFYSRGAYKLTGILPKFIFVVQETSYPFACSFVALDPEFKELGFKKMEAGMDVWYGCTTTKKWPGYPKRVCHISAPGWELAKWEVM